MLTGVLLLIGFSLAVSNNSSEYTNTNNPEFFEKPGACIGSYKFKVFQALDSGYALASEIEKDDLLGDMATGITVLFYSANKTPFYDEQIIEIPKGACAKQIGIYRYNTQAAGSKTVPVVQIMKK